MKTIILLALFLVATQTREFNVDYPDIHEVQKKRALIRGDLTIGALFPVHKTPAVTEIKNSLTCGAIREQYGIQRVEAALQTVDLINKSPDILPNITLGIEIRDTCWSPLIALHQSLKFIQKIFVAQDWSSCHPNSQNICQAHPPPPPPILGVIGPGSSNEAMQVQNLLQLFHIPQVGYSTTSARFSDKKKFRYFVRVVPSDKYQAQVMVKILQKYNCNYVFTVHSDGEYGRGGMNQFKLLTDERNICIASEHTVYDHTTKDELDEIVRKFDQNGKAKVVVCFCEGYDVRRLLEATKRTNKLHKFVFIGSDSWAGRNDVGKDIEDVAQGNIMINLHSPHVDDFDNYYFNFNKRNDSRNPWLEEFLNFRFKCTKEKATNLPPCTGKESLEHDYLQDPKLSFVIKSIYTLAHALHNYTTDICGKNAPVCSNLYPINRTLFMEYLQNVTFEYAKETIKFDNNGDPLAKFRYDIMNYQFLGNGSYGYTKVGCWIDNKLDLDIQNIQLPKGMTSLQSVCSKPCSPGYEKLLPQNGQQNITCCWSCIKCESNEFSNGEICQPCNKGFRPNDIKNDCVPINQEYVHYSDLIGIICIVFSTIGIISTVATALIFHKYGNTPVVKSSTKELCYMMFAGMIFAHSCTFILIGEPTSTKCTMVKIFPVLSLSVMYSALLVKTNRIWRIFSLSKQGFPTLRPKFMTTSSQVYISSVLISIQLVICVLSIWVSPARVDMNIRPVFRGNVSVDEAILECYISDWYNDLIFQFIFNAMLLSFCMLYAIKTRKLPDNLNEAKFIGFACYAAVITWLAFISIYVGSHFQIRVLSQCISLSTSALIKLIFLFFPKLYIMICKPEKNTRAYFKSMIKKVRPSGSTHLLTNKTIRSGFSLNTSNSPLTINQFGRKIQENDLNQLNQKPNPTREIGTQTCEMNSENIYFETTYEQEAASTSTQETT